jgi:hypothetical protein
MPCSLVHRYRRFRETCGLNLSPTVMIELTNSFETKVNMYQTATAAHPGLQLRMYQTATATHPGLQLRMYQTITAAHPGLQLRMYQTATAAHLGLQ